MLKALRSRTRLNWSAPFLIERPGPMRWLCTKFNCNQFDGSRDIVISQSVRQSDTIGLYTFNIVKGKSSTVVMWTQVKVIAKDEWSFLSWVWCGGGKPLVFNYCSVLVEFSYLKIINHKIQA